jgi:hypothetical protein
VASNRVNLVGHNMDSPALYLYKAPQMRAIFEAFAAMLYAGTLGTMSARRDDAPRALPLRRFPDGHDLDLLVDRRCRMSGVLQLLFAQTDRLNAFWRDLERRHQHVTDRGGSSLA